MSEASQGPSSAYQLAVQIANDLGIYGPTLHPSRDAGKIYKAFQSLRSRLENAERHRDEAREAVAEARHAIESEGPFEYDAMQRLRRSVDVFDHNFGSTVEPCVVPTATNVVVEDDEEDYTRRARIRRTGAQ